MEILVGLAMVVLVMGIATYLVTRTPRHPHPAAAEN
jgi:hypothetical protein